MSAQIECPICMEFIDMTKNCVTTECGHCFHANCLMTNVAHNGFGCPYCRTKMVEQDEEDADEEDAAEQPEQPEQPDGDSESDTESERDRERKYNEEDTHRGFRLFWNNLNGEQHDRDDVVKEIQKWDWDWSCGEFDNSNAPSASFVSQKFQQQGYTYEQVVKMLSVQTGFYINNDEFYNLRKEGFEKICDIIIDYSHEKIKASQNTSSEQVHNETQPNIY